jgi:hypothetical protein
MIRKRVGNEFWLIRQTDHAHIAGDIVFQIGNATVQRAEPLEQVVRATQLHDCGWPLHDDRPVLSAQKYPLDVFEPSRGIALKCWLAGARHAAEIDPYIGLLVSLHQLALSASSVSGNQPAKYDVQQLRQQFDLNKFQHNVIELLEKLRGQCGLQTHKPLRLGIGDTWTDDAEEKLKFGFRLLRAADVMSLALCCTKVPQAVTEPLHTRVGGGTIQLQLHRPSDDVLLVKPWPFTKQQLTLTVPYTPIPARAYADEADLHSTIASATPQTFSVQIRRS